MGHWFWTKRAPSRRPAPTPSPTPATPDPPLASVPEPGPSPAPGGGGFTVHCSDTSTRDVIGRLGASVFLPSTRGAFTFPAPWGTQGVRLTDGSDGDVRPVGYSYWRRINAHRTRPELSILVGRRGACALLVFVDKLTLATRTSELADVWGEGEQWYWDAVDPDVFYLLEGGTLLRYNIVTRSRATVCALGGGVEMWQPNGSADGKVHSATVKRLPNYDVDSMVVAYPSWQRIVALGAGGFDECQIDKSGRYLLVKEGGNANRIMDLDSGLDVTVSNEGGALGHSDNAWGWAVGEDDYHALPGAFVKMDFANPIVRGPVMYHTTDWQAMARHIGIAWDRPDPIGIVSSACRNNVPRANEIVKVPLDGSLQATLIAPNLTDLDGVGSDDYEKLPKANVDPYGEWACWSGNVHGRVDLFAVRIP